MPAPSAVLASLRPDIAASFEEFDLDADRLGFIGSRVLPMTDVAKQAGNFGIIPVEQLLQNRETARASGSGYSRGSWVFETGTFATVEHGAEEPVDDRESELYADYFDAELVSSKRARDVVLRNQERRIADMIFNTTTWNGAPLTTAIAGGSEWSNVTNGKPITDVQAAAKKVYDGIGMKPNALLVTWKTFWNMRRTVEVVDLIKYSGLVDPRSGNITPEAVAQALDLRYVFVAGAAKNTAAEGKAAAIASVWNDDMAMVCKVAETQDFQEPCLGRTFHWSEDGSTVGGTVETYREEGVRGEIVRVRHDVQEKVLYVAAGHLITNTTA